MTQFEDDLYLLDESPANALTIFERMKNAEGDRSKIIKSSEEIGPWSPSETMILSDFSSTSIPAQLHKHYLPPHGLTSSPAFPKSTVAQSIKDDPDSELTSIELDSRRQVTEGNQMILTTNNSASRHKRHGLSSPMQLLTKKKLKIYQRPPSCTSVPQKHSSISNTADRASMVCQIDPMHEQLASGKILEGFDDLQIGLQFRFRNEVVRQQLQLALRENFLPTKKQGPPRKSSPLVPAFRSETSSHHIVRPLQSSQRVGRHNKLPRQTPNFFIRPSFSFSYRAPANNTVRGSDKSKDHTVSIVNSPLRPQTSNSSRQMNAILQGTKSQIQSFDVKFSDTTNKKRQWVSGGSKKCGDQLVKKRDDPLSSNSQAQLEDTLKILKQISRKLTTATPRDNSTRHNVRARKYKS